MIKDIIYIIVCFVLIVIVNRYNQFRIKRYIKKVDEHKQVTNAYINVLIRLKEHLCDRNEMLSYENDNLYKQLNNFKKLFDGVEYHIKRV